MKAMIGGLALATALTLGTPGLTQELTPEQAAQADAFMLNNSYFVIFHEIGHMLVGELDIPVLGREEDAVDAISTLIMLNQEDEDYDRGVAVLADAIEGWLMMDETRDGSPIADSRMYDVHSLSRQRAFAIVCLMVGKDAESFGAVADDYGMDDERQETCEHDYNQASTSWGRLLEPHLLLEDGEPGADIVVEYDDEEDLPDRLAHIADILRSNEFLEEAAEAVTDSFVLPREVSFVAGQCNWVNAFYAPEEGLVVFCYEFADYLRSNFIQSEFGITMDPLPLPDRPDEEADQQETGEDDED